MAKKKKSGGGAGLISIALILGLIGFAALKILSSGDEALTEREMIANGVKSARNAKNITPRDEALLSLHLAIQDFRVKKGHPPSDLVELVPTYFDSIPKNASTGKAFEYKREGAQYSLLTGEEPTQLAALNTSQEQSAVATDVNSAIDNLAEDAFINPNDITQEDFVYDPTNRRDPFRPFDLSGKTTAVNEDIPPLERYDLSQLRVTAILGGEGGEFIAMVEDAKGKGYSVKEGVRIGDKGGNVVSIERDRIKVLEREIDFTGKMSENVTELLLYTKAK